MRRKRAEILEVLYSPGTPELALEWRRRLEALAQAVAAAHPLGGTVHLIIADDRRLRQLNAAYRRKDRATDVLSFDLSQGAEIPGAPQLRGEIYISLARAQAQAAEQQVPLLAELARLLVHGLLHLAGCDHGTPAGLHFMERQTDQFLQEAGLLSLPAAPRSA